MFNYRGRGCVVVAGGVLAAFLGSCAEEGELQPELRIEGPPDVLAVMVARAPVQSTIILEEATFCRPNDTKRPARVNLPNLSTTEVCPEDVGKTVETFQEAFPAFWYVRIMFDELLDYDEYEPDERARLTTRSQPVTHLGELRLFEARAPLAIGTPVSLTCNGVTVPYNAFYRSTGTRETWPVGPSIEIHPLNTQQVPANAVCEMSLYKGAIRDRDGISPAASQLGPYRFKIAPISLLIPYGAASAPYGTTGALPILGAGNPPFRIDFNHYLNPASFDASDVRVFRDAVDNDPSTPLTECGGGTEVAARVAEGPSTPGSGLPSSMTIADATSDGDWAVGSQYRVEVGGGQVADRAGGSNPLQRYTLCFRTR